MEFQKYSIPEFDVISIVDSTQFISASIINDSLHIFLVKTEDQNIEVIMNQDVTPLLPVLQLGVLDKITQQFTKKRFDAFVIQKIIYNQGILTLLLASTGKSFILQFQIQEEIYLLAHYVLKQKPIELFLIEQDFYIVSQQLIQKLSLDALTTVYDQFGKEKVQLATNFSSKIAVLLDTQNIIIFDPLTQTIDKKVKSQDNVVQLFSEEDILISLGILQNSLHIQLITSAYDQKVYQFNLTNIDQKIQVAKIQQYESDIIVVFSVENGPTFAAVLTSSTGQLLEINGIGQKLLSVSINEITKIQETRDILYGTMKSARIDPLVAELFDCSEIYSQEQVKGKISIIGEIKCTFITTQQIIKQSLYHQQFLACKSLQNQDLPIGELFQYAIQLFTSSKIIKEDRVLFEKELNIQSQLTPTYQSSNEKLAEIVVFACLRYQELLPLLVYFVERQEQRLDMFNNVPVYSMNNVRPLSQFLQYLVDEACKLLEQAFQLFKDLKNQSLTEETLFFATISQLDAFQPIVQSSVQIMQILVNTRSKFNIFSDVIKQAYFTIMQGMAFISISKILKIFGSNKKQSSLLQVFVPLTNEGASVLGIKKEQDFDISQNTFIDEETSNFHNLKQENFLYSKDFGYYTVDENLQIAESDTYSIANYDTLYQKLSMDGNTAIFSVVNFICQNFGSGEYVRLTINDILEMIMPTKLQKTTISSIHAKLYESALYSLVLIFGYILFSNNSAQTEIYQFLYDISPFLQDTKKNTIQLYLLSKIFSQIDAGEKELEIDALQGNIINQQDYEGLYNDLLLLGAGRSQNDDIKVYLINALQQLPPPFVLDDTYDLQAQKQETGQLWASRLTQLAISRCRINLAKSMSFFSPCKSPRQQNKIILWPLHECITGTELFLRACLISFVLNFNIADLVVLITQIRVFLNSFISNQTDCITNRRIGVFYSQIAINQFEFDQYFKIKHENISTSDLNENQLNLLASSGYNNQFKPQPRYKIPSALILYQQISDLEKKIITAFSISNNVSNKFLLVFLYQNDVQICLQFIKFLETQQVQLDQDLISLLTNVKQQLSIIPQFLTSKNIRKTCYLSSDDDFIQPSLLLPDAFKDDLEQTLQQLQQSITQSMNLSITGLQQQDSKIESPVLQPILIEQQQGAMNFLELMAQNKPVYNVKYNMYQGYNKPQQQSYNLQNNYNQVRMNAVVQNQQLYTNQVQQFPNNQQLQKFQPLQYKQQPPTVRKTKAQELRDASIKAKLEQEKIKDQVKQGVPRQGIIGQKPINVGKGQFQANTYQGQNTYQNIYQNNQQVAQQQYQQVQPQKYGQPTTQYQYDQFSQPQQQNLNMNNYQFQENKYVPQQQAFDQQKQTSFNPSFAPSIQSNLQYNQPKPMQIQKQNNPFNQTQNKFQLGNRNNVQIQQIQDDHLVSTAQFIPTNNVTKPSILKNQMRFNNVQSPVTKKKGVAFDITL